MFRKFTRPKVTTRRAIIGGSVAVVIAQLILLGLTGQGSPSPIIPERWLRRRMP